MIPLLIIVFSIFNQLLRITAFNEKMAWRSSGSTHRELIENLYKNGLIKDQRIREAMLQVDRSDFTENKNDAYEDRPQSSILQRKSLLLRTNLYYSIFSWLCGKCIYVCFLFERSMNFILQY